MADDVEGAVEEDEEAVGKEDSGFPRKSRERTRLRFFDKEDAEEEEDIESGATDVAGDRLNMSTKPSAVQLCESFFKPS